MPRERNPDAPQKAVSLSDYDRGSLDDLLYLARRGYLGSNEVAQSIYAHHEDSVDGTNSTTLKFWMPRGMTKIADMGLRFALLPFRSYSKTAATGGQATVTSGASSVADTAAVAAGTSGAGGTEATAPGGGVDAPVNSGGNTVTVTGLPAGWDVICGGKTATEVNGTATLDMTGVEFPVASITIRDASDTEMTTLTPEGGVWGGNVFAASWEHTHTGPLHEHSVPSHVHLMPHTHTVDIADHEHDPIYGIYEGTSATGVTVSINGTDRTAALGGGAGFTTDQNWLDINRTGWLTFGVADADCLNTIVLTSTRLGRIRAQVDGLVMRGLAQ